MEDAEQRLRRELTEVRLAPAYEAAIEKGIKEALAWWPDNRPIEQSRVARKTALKELAAQLGWDVQ